MSTKTTAPVETPLELADIQGDILRAHGNRYTHTTYLFVHLSGGEQGRAWIGELADQVTTAVRPELPPQHHVNVAITCAGLAALGLDHDFIEASFSSEFVAGMAARAERLHDVGPNAHEHWEEGLGTGEGHVLLTINAQGGPARDAAVDGAVARLEGHGHAVVHRTDAHLHDGSREHFGFQDGFAQPAIKDVSEEKTVGGGIPPTGGHGWRPFEKGEFILGYWDEDTRLDPERVLPSAPAEPFGRNGTYMVWRKLQQHVGRFRETLEHAADHYATATGTTDVDAAHERLKAKVVGRWTNGAPLMDYPDAPPLEFPPKDASHAETNGFLYHREDHSGGRCPIGSHIRRTNPRDSIGWDGSLTFRHRIIRRGMPYGDPLPAGEADVADPDRGLVFVCFNASISRQFEAIQVQWVNDGNVFGLGHDSDFLMGSPEGGSMVVQGEPPFYLSPSQTFVTLRGGEYLFVPGITALRALASGEHA